MRFLPAIAILAVPLGGCELFPPAGVVDGPPGVVATRGTATPAPLAAVRGPALAEAAPQPLPAPPPGAKWEMPWQLAIASSASEAQGEQTYVATVQRYGNVRGTKAALTYINYPLDTITAAPGRNMAVRPCRGVVEGEARKKGGVRVEAASAGPGRRTTTGYEGPVAFRVLYCKPDGYEVRQSILECKLDRGGTIKDAFVVEMPGSKLARATENASYAALPPGGMTSR